jgi:hypothetical protein
MLAVMQPALGNPWDDADWRASVRRWIDERAAALGLARTGPLRTLHRRPWSLVLRTGTSAGPIFFKATAPTLANDPALTSHLADLAPDLVLRPLAVDAERRWMLLPPGGRRLRGLPGEALLRHWERLLPRYATLQLDTLDTDDTLLARGALDRRPSRLAEQLRAFLASPAKTRVGRHDGLTAEEVDRLVRQLPAIAERAGAIEAAGIGHSIQHDDLHDGNVFVGSGGDRIFDWGDAAVSHPFGSLVVSLTSIADRLGRPDGAPELRRLRDAYLEPWRAGRSDADLEAGISAVERVYPLMRALTWAAAFEALPTDAEHEHRGAVAAWARAFLEAETG